MVKITYADEHGVGYKAGIRADDMLLQINGHEIRDVLDYRFYLTDTHITLSLTRDGAPFTATVRKGEYDDIGLSFQTPLMDKKHTCANRCVFCFVDQNPEGLRESLYFKDDDDRLSFLHGNYVTLTNLKDADIDRLITMHLSPVNVSVHTTNPQLRVEMMKNKRAGQVLCYLDRLADAGIALCTQIVLCKGLNDGAELDRSMKDLLKLYPALRSCAIVPVGLTRHRAGLYPLESFTPDECRAVIEQVTAFGDKCLSEQGTRLFYCSDEFYIQAGIPLPSEDFYEDYSQIENGVGMITSLASEFDFELDYLADYLSAFRPPRTVSLVTGVAAYDHIAALCKRLEKAVPGLTVHVHRIINHFFGDSVTVAGLLTGQDVISGLKSAALGDQLLYPAVMEKADEAVFLDGMTPEELSHALGGIPVRAVKSDGAELIKALLGIQECN